MIEERAHAKVNLTLEVLARRADGYHEIRSVAQTIELHDTLYLGRADTWSVRLEGSEEQIEDDLQLRAGRLLEKVVGRSLPTSIRCQKRIPISAGLGGGSSDAAAALRGLNRLWDLGLSPEQLRELASRLGSDVPFLVQGGTVLLAGRGEVVAPLPPLPDCWLVLAVPPISLAAKTSGMYARLNPSHFTMGEHSAGLVERLIEGRFDTGAVGWNVFDAVADEAFPGLAPLRRQLEDASGLRFYLAGAGPTLFALFEAEQAAERCALSLAGQDSTILLTRTTGGSRYPK